MSNVTKLPTASPSYVTVRKRGGGWDVMLVTPCPGRAIKTRLISTSDEAMAYEQARETAARIFRPFRARGAAA